MAIDVCGVLLFPFRAVVGAVGIASSCLCLGEVVVGISRLLIAVGVCGSFQKDVHFFVLAVRSLLMSLDGLSVGVNGCYWLLNVFWRC